ncbi:TfoX/Sxy family DNA transformation protein [Ruegeria atlantica]|uniref:TfoX/Sxy family DNA transformation protein n=1 Tax=Ruegeria atlantica TaxID=81569 RepID=UPI00147F2D98|nr:TfoX/Sxy family DNA transformation protein [Ruegeria atlantica]
MSDPVSSIRNLGPAFEQACTHAGIRTAQQLRDLGPDEAYARLLRFGTRPHFIGYYVLVMGLQGRPWNDCKGDEKKALRQRFDAIKTSVTAMPETQMISDLDAIGVRVSADDLKPV